MNNYLHIYLFLSVYYYNYYHYYYCYDYYFHFYYNLLIIYYTGNTNITYFMKYVIFFALTFCMYIWIGYIGNQMYILLMIYYFVFQVSCDCCGGKKEKDEEKVKFRKTFQKIVALRNHNRI